MKYKLLPLLLLFYAVSGRTENPAHVCVRHLVLPTPYPILARAARLQGTVVAKLSISAEGIVTAAKVDSEDSLLAAHPLLQYATERLVRNWTFECASCAPGSGFEQVIKFNYRLQGEDSDYDKTEVSLDLPGEVDIVARPPRVNTSSDKNSKRH